MGRRLLPRLGQAPTQLEVKPQAGGCRPSVASTDSRAVSSSYHQLDDVLRYRGYSPNHIAAILSLLECHPSDLGDYLEDSNDYDSDKTGGDETPSDDQVGD
ncbi:UNVERIFIED_CONTAM: hypothetical protein Sangu_2459200 [Sesamum angustifolium]|uniref:Uncharacterized protein n=1 Tax=Sesamum angustifolium TaxID=2727405 RepID=A0AAW2ISU9_9LAMI